MSKTLSTQQMMRYNRHIALPAMDIDGQEKLLNSHILVIGMGGLGCAVAPYLTAAGVGSLTLVDDDTVDSHNLQRQVLFSEKDLNEPKVDAAKSRLTALNSDTHIKTVNARVDEVTLQPLIKNASLVVDCCDNLITRNAVNNTCLSHQTPLVSGSAIRFEGQVASFSMQNNTGCYGCLSQFFGEQQLSCTEAGVLSPLVGVIGTMQAVEAIKIAANIGQPLYSSLLLFDALHSDWQRMNLQPHPHCPYCGCP